MVSTLVVFGPALRFDYVDYDDGVYVYANKAVLHGLSLDGVHYAFTSTAGGSWMPMTWLSHMLDVTLFGAAPIGPHATNILLHALSSGLLLVSLIRITQRVWPCFFVAALFAFHPLRNESVVWIAERKDVLSTCFWMLGLLTYSYFVKQPTRRNYLLLSLCLLLGLMAKPMVVSFPVCLLLLDFWPLNRLGHDWRSLRTQLKPRLYEKLPLLLLAVLFCVATYWSQRHTGAVNTDDIALVNRAERIVANVGFYVEKHFLPSQLTAIHPPTEPTHLQASLLVIAFLGFTGLVVRRAFREPWLLIGWGWFLITLLPVIGIIRIGHISVAERYSYIPSIGLTWMVVWTAASWGRSILWKRIACSTVGVMVLLACVVTTRIDLPRWKNSFTLFESAIHTAPYAVTYNNIAVAYLDQGQYEKAIEPLSMAIELQPNYIKAIVNRATAYQHTGRMEEARADYGRLVQIEPQNPKGYNNRAQALMKLGRLEEAVSDYTKAISLDPASAPSYNNRATVRLMKRDFHAAVADSDQAIQLDPKYANAYTTRGNACQGLGDLSAALEAYNIAIEITPGDAMIYNNRAAVWLQLKQYDQAWADVRRCQELGGTPHAGLMEMLTKVFPR